MDSGGREMEKNGNMYQKVMSIAAIIVGNFLYALAVKLFLLPAGLVTGGTTGMALTVNYLTGIPISGFVLIFNVIMLALGYAVLGRTFASTTLGSTFLYPLALEIFNRTLDGVTLTQDILLCTLFSGIGIGVALGIVIRSGASTGGMDIPPLVLNRYFRIPVSVSMYAFDVCILLSQALFRKAENILYGIVLVLIYTVVLDKMLLMGTTRTEVRIISQKPEEIRDAILRELDRGVTMLEGESGYLRNRTQMIFSVISNRELPRLERLVRGIDPESFMVVNRVSEVKGRGFSLNKKYQ